MAAVPEIGDAVFAKKLYGALNARIHVRKPAESGFLRRVGTKPRGKLARKIPKPALQIHGKHRAVRPGISHARKLRARDAHYYNIDVKLSVVDFQIVNHLRRIGARGKPFLRRHYFLNLLNIVVAQHSSVKCENARRNFHADSPGLFRDVVLDLESRVNKLPSEGVEHLGAGLVSNIVAVRIAVFVQDIHKRKIARVFRYLAPKSYRIVRHFRRHLGEIRYVFAQVAVQRRERICDMHLECL